ncbi:morphogenetic protein [Pseudomonas umsongensis]|uniref:Morphogenetic protein n=1 Tax=Pseudomonas umsongensis TaxID=198618 RepID=A0AAE7DEN3_9PSED|nr:morphogenetic protein [Pseudomonas umsongensis]QJC78915.1 morphogenetic protein [Pseudomonas umsongensis]
MSQVKERPILFSAPMVRAIVEGRKTVTRRAVKFPLKDKATGRWLAGNEIGPVEVRDNSPFGQPGERLWVRETWARIGIAQAPDQEWVVYRESDNRTDYGGPWKPGIHMFRRDSRILLEITAVRVERLQDISEEQCAAEGVRAMRDDSGALVGREGPGRYVTPWPTRKEAFRDIWESVGGDWAANPWVWVVEFKKVTP